MCSTAQTRAQADATMVFFAAEPDKSVDADKPMVSERPTFLNQATKHLVSTGQVAVSGPGEPS